MPAFSATAPLKPVAIHGPAWLGHNGVILYFQGDIMVTDEVETWNPETSDGPLGERFAGRRFTITGSPRGVVSTTMLDYLYGPLRTPANIGKSLIPAANKAIVIYSKADNITTSYNIGALVQPPEMTLSPRAQIYGQATWAAIGDVTKSMTDAAFLKTMATWSSADTSFDETAVITDSYSAAVGSRTTPYAAIGAQAGFKISPKVDVGYLPDADTGYADIILTGLGLELAFAPKNLTEAQVDTLLALEDAGALIPGKPIGRENIVITGTQNGWAFTLLNMGAKKNDRGYKSMEYRLKDLHWVNHLKYTTGAIQPLLSYTAPAS